MSASWADGAWPVVVSAYGAYKDSSMGCTMSVDFDQSPASMTVSLVPTNVGGMKATDVSVGVTWAEDTWPIGVSGGIGYGG
eukprot:1116181-Prymnesium_polylepis.1